MKRLLFGAFVMIPVLLLSIACTPSPTRATPVPSPTPRAATSTPVAPALSTLSPKEAAWAKVVDAARKEGEVVVYSTFANPPFRQAFEQTFTRKYGVKAEWVMASGAQNKEKLAVEQRSKQYVGDIYHGGPTPMLDMMAKGMLLQFRGPVYEQTLKDVWEVSPYEYDDTGHIMVTQGSLILNIVINTNLVKPADYPQSYRDLLDPKWKGKLAIFDPTTGGGGSVFFTRLAEDPSYGLDYWRKMAKQDVQFQSSNDATDRSVALGERSMGIGSVFSSTRQYLEARAPIQMWYPPQDGRTITLSVMSIVNNAPHPNAAQLLVNFMLSKEGQDLLDIIGEQPIRKDAKFEAHPQVIALRNVPIKYVFGRKPSEKASEYLLNKTAAEIFGLGK